MKLTLLFTFPFFASAQSLGKGTKFNITFSGRGCPIGSVSASMSPDRDIMTLSLDKVQVYTGPGSYPSAKTQNCVFQIIMELPNSDTQYSLVENTYHGYQELERGIIVSFVSTWYSSENANETMTTQTSVEGSSVGEVFTKRVAVPEGGYVWSRCGRTTTWWSLNERVALTSRVRGVEGEFLSEDGGPLVRQLRFLYRECN